MTESVSVELNELWTVATTHLPGAVEEVDVARQRLGNSISSGFRQVEGFSDANNLTYDQTHEAFVDVLEAMREVMLTTVERIETAVDATKLIVLHYAASDEYSAAVINLSGDLRTELGR